MIKEYVYHYGPFIYNIVDLSHQYINIGSCNMRVQPDLCQAISRVSADLWAINPEKHIVL